MMLVMLQWSHIIHAFSLCKFNDIHLQKKKIRKIKMELVAVAFHSRGETVPHGTKCCWSQTMLLATMRHSDFHVPTTKLFPPKHYRQLMSLCLSLSVPIFLLLSVSLFISLSVPIFLSLSLFLSLSVPIFLLLSLTFSPSLSLSFSPSLYLSSSCCLSLTLSLSLPHSPYVSLQFLCN